MLDLRSASRWPRRIGIALVAGAAAAINCLVEQKIDALMARTAWRPLPRGELTPRRRCVFALVVGGSGLALLYFEVNALTMWLTLATFVGYAIVYTVMLKPMTPQNIVIGGASGAMPPVLGWAAVTGDVPFQALLLFLIIFAGRRRISGRSLCIASEVREGRRADAAGHPWRQVHAPARAVSTP